MSSAPSGNKPRRFPLRLDQVAATPARPTSPRELLRPQAPLEHAARDRRQQSTPQGLGMDSRAVQRRMVERLYADGIRHQRLLEAFSAIPRHWFVDSALVNQAYEDTSLPIGLGQTISKPSVIGSMIELLCVRPGLTPETVHPLGHCLDIGTGCGYQAALLSVLSRRVVSVERLRDLHLKARANLDRLRRDMPHWQDVRLVYGDGMLGHPPNAPYDTIIAAAGGAAVPQPWIEQLAPGGRLVAPMEDPRTGHQVLTIIDRLPNGQLQQAVAGQVLFVPLKSGTT
ncbi:MAG TPA: protein-L-isoaspartate O-methyltransferase [Aquabacterium sp.]|uniref:protein-L-isoaspartate O-methyltransferase n=1 Tax=Aquabacterium sp. TaxID=1872578 RepID=UPI002D953DD5|nr:protein-L-isoaspartate O-methyltransferase [Aquabacterium sp.]HET6787124.1 protein-L-isoaspartate O-methyltransferase [Aquabacterium sp.]HEX5372730.1 protein-L-isoaspartate O-methyltransferase [Aquabacterium sp.]